jgi:hypothetical protein
MIRSLTARSLRGGRKNPKYDQKMKFELHFCATRTLLLRATQWTELILFSPWKKEREIRQWPHTSCWSRIFVSSPAKRHCWWWWVQRASIQHSNHSRQNNLNNTCIYPYLMNCVFLPGPRTNSRQRTKTQSNQMQSLQMQSFGQFLDQMRPFVIDSGTVASAYKTWNSPSLLARLIQTLRWTNTFGFYKSFDVMRGWRNATFSGTNKSWDSKAVIQMTTNYLKRGGWRVSIQHHLQRRLHVHVLFLESAHPQDLFGWCLLASTLQDLGAVWLLSWRISPG